MARTILNLPEIFQFSTSARIRICDINYAGHLGNDKVLSLIHEARARFLAGYGYTELNIDGVGLVIADCVIIYKSECFFGDLCIMEVAVNGFSRHGCDFYYRLTNSKTGNEIARAKTGIVFYDYQTKKTAPVPSNFKKRVHAENPPSDDSVQT